MLLNNPYFKEKKKLLGKRGNISTWILMKNTMYQNVHVAPKAVFRGKFVALKACIKI